MTHFLQLHLLTAYPPSNLNRDDLGRPKSAVMGGANRLRISSQSLKRAWRTSDLFKAALAAHLGTRTKRMGTRVLQSLVAQGLDEDAAQEAAAAIAGVFGKVKTAKKEPKKDAKKDAKTVVETEQLVHFAPEEIAAIDGLTATLAAEKRQPTEEELASLASKRHRAVDVALFGRMLAAAPALNVEAAAQVAHGMTVHQVAIESDYFSAVDDLNKPEEEDDAGAAHIGETEFGAGLFYLYLCVDRDLLARNLGGDEELAGHALRALTEAAAKIAPRGKQATFASRAYASYILAEAGRQQPRSLAVAFLHPVDRSELARKEGFLPAAVAALDDTRAKMDRAYGPTSETAYVMDTGSGRGSLDELLAFVAAPLPEGSHGAA